MNPVAFPINESFLHCRHEKIQTWKCPNCMKNLYQTQASTRQRSTAHQAAQVLVPMGLFLCLIGGSVHAVCGITDKIRQVVRITTDQLIKAGWTYPALVSILSTVMLWLLLCLRTSECFGWGMLSNLAICQQNLMKEYLSQKN